MGDRSFPRSALLKALVASFGIYLLPVIGPHALAVLGEHLWLGLSHYGPARPAGWIALEWALALTLQVAAFGLAWFFFAKPGWRRLAIPVLCAPLFFVVAEWAFLIAIPSRFLIEPDTAPESGEWKTVCTFPDMAVAQVRCGSDLPLERAGQTWLSGRGMNEYSVLTMPGCTTVPLALQNLGPSYTIPFVLPGGHCLLSTWDNRTGRAQPWYVAGNGAVPRALPSPPEHAAPVLSSDGKWIAWLEHVPGITTTPLPERLSVHSLADSTVLFGTMPPLGRFSFVLLNVDPDAGEFTLYGHEYATRQDSISVFGFDGERRGDPVVAEGVSPQSTTFVRVGPGWVAWDAYRDNEPYRLAWRLPQGRGMHRVLNGRGITSVAVDPGGSYIAVSVTTALNIGHIKDAVYVLRTRDGAEVWRRYLPAYTRSALSFPGNRHFAYTDWDGTHSTVRILELSR
jgi:hypothetical protein